MSTALLQVSLRVNGVTHVFLQNYNMTLKTKLKGNDWGKNVFKTLWALQYEVLRDP